MNLCSCDPFVRRNNEIPSDPYKSSYDLSHYYENVVDHPFIHARMKRKIQDDSNAADSSMVSKMIESVSKNTFVPKYWENCNSTDFFRRSSLASKKSSLKTLHEKFIVYPPRPLKWGSTTTGSTYVLPEKPQHPKCWSSSSPVKNFTLDVSSPCREGLPTFLPNECGYTKHVDPYISTSQLAHCNFSEDQQNSLARKNVITFYDTIGLPKNRGFGSKKLQPFGSYFHREKIVSCRVQTRPDHRVPFNGIRSTYEDSYDAVPNRLINDERDIGYPIVYKPVDLASWCTEKCHVGTGWPVRGSVDIGQVRGTY